MAEPQEKHAATEGQVTHRKRVCLQERVPPGYKSINIDELKTASKEELCR